MRKNRLSALCYLQKMNVGCFNNWQKYMIITLLCLLILIYLFKWMYPPAVYERDYIFHVSDMVSKFVSSNNASKCSGYGRSARFNSTKGCRQRLPNCIIIGVVKGGTLALLTFLSAHPQIVRNKEINEYDFFDNNYENGLDWYKDRMPYSLPGQITIEKSPRYFDSTETPERIFKMDPNIHLILIVRDPVRRAISAYHMAKRKREKHEDHKNVSSFELSWRGYAKCYDDKLEQWLHYFKRKQIHIVDGDALINSPAPELTEIEKFLKIDHFFDDKVFVFNSEKGFYCLKRPAVDNMFGSDEAECLFRTKGHEHPPVSPNVLKEMKDYFRPHNQRFYDLCQRQFDWDFGV